MLARRPTRAVQDSVRAIRCDVRGRRAGAARGRHRTRSSAAASAAKAASSASVGRANSSVAARSDGVAKRRPSGPTPLGAVLEERRAAAYPSTSVASASPRSSASSSTSNALCCSSMRPALQRVVARQVIPGTSPVDVLGEGIALQLDLSRPLNARAQREVQHLDRMPRSQRLGRRVNEVVIALARRRHRLSARCATFVTGR